MYGHPDISIDDPKTKDFNTMQNCDTITRTTSSLTSIVQVVVIFVGGYGLGANDTDVRVACVVGASCLFLFVFLSNISNIIRQQQYKAFVEWLIRKTSFSTTSLRRVASKSSGSALSTLSRVTSVGAIKNISSNFLSTLDCSKSIRSAIQSISRKECFARLDFIERLSINDISVLFRYAVDANLDGFDEKIFLANQTETIRSVITAIDMAVKVSRGSLSEGTKIISTEERNEGDIDALRFVAVIRVFAEWRNVRMVPKGYQRYAIRLSLGYRDVLQNLEKIERGVHEYLRYNQSLMGNKNEKRSTVLIPSPTLRQLLQFEARTKVHKRLPSLEDRSSASGLLWAKRQLHYQTELFGNLLEVPECYASSEEAALAAYRTVYTEYHGWAVRQIFTRSFGGSPPLEKIWMVMCPPKDSPKTFSTIASKFKAYSSKEETDLSDRLPPLRSLSDIQSTTTTSASEKMEMPEEHNEVLAALDKFRHEVIEKWEDLLRMFNCGKEEKRKVKESLILSSESHFNLSQYNRDMVESSLQTRSIDGDSLETSVILTNSTCCSQQQTSFCAIEKSKRDVDSFVRGVSPMIADLGILINELNMNDPGRA